MLALRLRGFKFPAISMRSPTGTGSDSNLDTRSFLYPDPKRKARHNALDSYNAAPEDVPSPSKYLE